jgi:hypothetical protein
MVRKKRVKTMLLLKVSYNVPFTIIAVSFAFRMLLNRDKYDIISSRLPVLADHNLDMWRPQAA